jgi:hypothetical protein
MREISSFRIMSKFMKSSKFTKLSKFSPAAAKKFVGRKRETDGKLGREEAEQDRGQDGGARDTRVDIGSDLSRMGRTSRRRFFNQGKLFGVSTKSPGLCRAIKRRGDLDHGR